jgi:hypothetical protein
MPASSGQFVVPPGEHLFHPLHNSRKLKPVIGLDVKAHPVSLKAEAPDLEGETEHGFPEYPEEEGDGPRAAEERFPVVDAGTNLIPDALGKFACLSHASLTGPEGHFALVGRKKN